MAAVCCGWLALDWDWTVPGTGTGGCGMPWLAVGLTCRGPMATGVGGVEGEGCI